MKNIFGLALLATVCFADTAWAQPVSGRLPKEKMMQIGDESMGAKDTYTALEWYNKVYEADPEDVEAIYKIANTHDQLRDYKSAEEWYKRLLDADKNASYPLTRFWYAYTLKLNEKYDESILQFIAFEKDYNGDKAEYYKKRCKVEIDGARYAKGLSEPAEALEIANAGRSINSSSTEGTAYPIGRDTLIFTALRSDTMIFIDEEAGHKHAHIYFSKRADDGQAWDEAKPFSTAVEKKGFHAVHPAFTPDRKKFYFSRAQLQGNYLSNSRILMGDVTNGQISNLKELDFNSSSYSCKDPYVANINGTNYLFFSSDMPSNSQGGWDIWVAEIKEDGSTYQPINLGAPVNTFMDEITPYFDKREMLLYFSSNGHPSIGGLDVFRSKRGASMSEWGGVENMGLGFNSRVDDFGFVINDKGNDDCYGYVTSNRPGTISLKSETCCDDIFSVLMPDRCDIICKLDLFDETTKKDIIGATVQLVDKSTGKVVDEQSNKDGNDYTFFLDRNKQYEFKTKKDGFEATKSATVETTPAVIGEVKKPVEISKESYMREIGLMVETFNRKDNSPLSGVTVIVMNPATKQEVTRLTQNSGNRFMFPINRDKDYEIIAELTSYNGDKKTVVMKDLGILQKLYLEKPEVPEWQLVDILFDFDRANLRDDAVKTLDEVIAILQKNQNLVLEVSGHTDAKGSNKYNTRLAERRTQAALKYLKEKGIDEKRLVPAAFGEEKPKAANDNNGQDDPNGRQLNRRVEFKIVQGDKVGTTSVSPTLSTNNTTKPVTTEEKKKVSSTTTTTTKTDNTTATKTESVKDTRKPTTAEFSIKKGTNLGQLKFGQTKDYSVEITNTGSENLYIDFVQGSCNCTTPMDYPKKAIAPGQKGVIKFQFDTNKASVQDAYNSGLEIYGNVKDGLLIWDFTVDVKK